MTMRARLAKNLLYLYGAETAGKLLAIYVFGRLARVLGDARFGDLEFSLGALFVLNLLLDAGLAPFGVREASRDPGKTSSLADRIVMLRVFIALAAVPLLILAGVLRGADHTATLLVAMQGLVLCVGPFVLNWVFESRNQMQLVALASLLRQVVLAAGTTLFVCDAEDLLLVPVCDAVGLAAAVSLQQFFYRRHVGRLAPWRGLSGTVEILRASLPMSVSALVWALRLFPPTLALGYLAASRDVGHFGAAHRLLMAAHAFVWLYFVNLLPTLSRQAEEGDAVGTRRILGASLRLIGWGSAVALPVGWLLAPLVIRVIYGEGFAAAVLPLRLMLVVLVLAFLSGHARYGLIAVRRQNQEMLASVVGGMISIVACLSLAAELRPDLAGLVLVAAESAAFAAAAFAFRRHFSLFEGLRPLVAPGLFAAATWMSLHRWGPESAVLQAVLLAAIMVVIAWFWDLRHLAGRSR